MFFRLINRLQPGSVKKINTMKAPFKQVSRQDITETSNYKIGVINLFLEQHAFTNTFSYFQRENIELFLKGCEAYGLKPQDLFQVNDLYENKNLYMIVDNLFLLGGHVSSN